MQAISISQSFETMKNHCQRYSVLEEAYNKCMIERGRQMLNLTWQRKTISFKNREFYNDLLRNFNSSSLWKIYRTTILMNLKFKPNTTETRLNITDMAAHIQQVLQPFSFKSLDLTIRSQLLLMEDFTNYLSNDDFLLKAAYFWSQIRKHKHYDKLSGIHKVKIESFIASLPFSLRNYFFNPQFCLINDYFSTFLYVGDAIDVKAQSRNVFLWNVEDLPPKNTKWVQIVGDNFAIPIILETQLLNNATNTFLYWDQQNNNTNMVVSNEFIGLDWTLEYHHEFLFFSKNQYLLCANNSLYDAQNRFVVVIDRNGENQPRMEYCQWFAVNCDTNLN